MFGSRFAIPAASFPSLEELRIRYEVDPSDRARIPDAGAVMVVVNQPFGRIEAAVFHDLLRGSRRDVKILANGFLTDLDELEDHLIPADQAGGVRIKIRNDQALGQAVAWLQRGSMLVMFQPDGVRQWNSDHGGRPSTACHELAARLTRLAGADVLPVHFGGSNALRLRFLGMPGFPLRNVPPVWGLLSKENHTLILPIGSLIPSKALRAIPDDREAAQYIRWRINLLAQRGRAPISLVPRLIRSALGKRLARAIAPETNATVLEREVNSLDPPQVVERCGDIHVCLARAEQIPNVLRELGRLREITFRAAGEGTGDSLDLDEFDSYYHHLFAWNQARREIVSAYRVGDTQEILAARGIRGLYTSKLFHYDPSFFARIGPALELGRSFVRPEYQRLYSPLMVLWKGLCGHIVRQPRTPVLFGAVSISNSYSTVSRSLLAHFFEARRTSDELAGLVKPRRPFRIPKTRARELTQIVKCCPCLDDLTGPIADAEAGRKGVPVLLRHYVNAGGRLLGFSIDKNFSNTLDGLILVDLRLTNPALLARYMTDRGAAEFLRFHRKAAGGTVAGNRLLKNS